MESTQSFRSAFNGFNREDVVHYIQYLNSKHAGELNQLHSELELLRAQVQEPAELPEDQSELVQQLQEQVAALEQELAEAKAENAKIRAEVPSVVSRNTDELEAYRRAERMERMAMEHTRQLYRQANGALADASAQVDDAAALITDVSGRVMAQLEELRVAVTASKQTLQAAAATMYTIRPTEDF